MRKPSKALSFAVLLIVALYGYFLTPHTIAQVGGITIQIATSNPAGNACASTQVVLYIPSGALFTCVSGTLTAAGGGASSAIFGGMTAVAKGNLGATPTFDLTAVSSKSPVRFEGTVNLAITAITFTNATAGAKFSIKFLQDGTGHTVAYGGSASNTCTISITAGKYTLQEFEVASDGTTVQGSGCTSDDPQPIPTTQGGTGLTTATDDTVAVYNGTGADQKALPNCTDTGGQHLNYTTSTNAFSCGTSGGGGSFTPTDHYQFVTAGSAAGNAYLNGWTPNPAPSSFSLGGTCNGTAQDNICWLAWTNNVTQDGQVVFHGIVPHGWTSGTVNAQLTFMNVPGGVMQFTLQTGCLTSGTASGSWTYNTAQNFTAPNGAGTTFYTVTISGVTMTGCAADQPIGYWIKRTDMLGQARMVQFDVIYTVP